MKNTIKLLLFVFIPFKTFCQRIDTDNLIQALRTNSTDQNRYNLAFNLGDYYTEINFDSAIIYLNECLALALKNNKKIEEASTLDYLGYALMKQGKFGESLKCFQEAFKVAQDSTIENKSWKDYNYSILRKTRIDILCSLNMDFGLLMGAVGKNDQKLLHFNKAKKIAENYNDTIKLGFANMNLGSVYLDLNKLDSALLLEEYAEQIFIKKNYKPYLSSVYRLASHLHRKQPLFRAQASLPGRWTVRPKA